MTADEKAGKLARTERVENAGINKSMILAWLSAQEIHDHHAGWFIHQNGRSLSIVIAKVKERSKSGQKPARRSSRSRQPVYRIPGHVLKAVRAGVELAKQEATASPGDAGVVQGFLLLRY